MTAVMIPVYTFWLTCTPNSAVSSGSLLIQACVLVLIVIYGIRIVQRGHVTAVDPVFRRSVLCLFFLRHVLIEQEVLIDQCLHILKLRRDLVHIQLSAGCLRGLCALALRCTLPTVQIPVATPTTASPENAVTRTPTRTPFQNLFFVSFSSNVFSPSSRQPDLIR